MSTFVILAAGRGSRVGGSIHKALLPLEGIAILSHLFRLAPKDAKIVVCTGYNAEHIQEYIQMAEPGRKVELVPVPDWDGPSGGPGWSLLKAEPYVEGDMYFTTCDTLWDECQGLWDIEGSWLGTAPLPAGTPPARWCRVMDDGTIVDKRPQPDGGAVHTGMGMIAEEDQSAFFRGIQTGSSVQGETQMSAGFQALDHLGQVRLPGWLDVGDREAYSRAVRLRDGFDWSKPQEATYLLPDRVVKYWPESSSMSGRMAARARLLEDAVPDTISVTEHMLAMERVNAEPSYGWFRRDTDRILEWADETIWVPARVEPDMFYSDCRKFYLDKTHERVELLRPELRIPAADVVSRIDWDDLISRSIPTRIHGDFMYGNILIRPNGVPIAVDWRPDFAGRLSFGDQRYDLAKLLSGTYIHWDNARHGDFRACRGMETDRTKILDYARWRGYRPMDILTLAALVFINSAPLHNPPFDEILVWHGTRMLEDFTS